MKIMIITKTKTHYHTVANQNELQTIINKIEITETIISVLNY